MVSTKVEPRAKTQPFTEGRVLEWLIEGDPAICWQTLRDLTDAKAKEVEAARRRVALEGWGAKLLALQDPEGTWAHGL